jgi:hypothetical protein
VSRMAMSTWADELGEEPRFVISHDRTRRWPRSVMDTDPRSGRDHPRSAGNGSVSDGAW